MHRFFSMMPNERECLKHLLVLILTHLKVHANVIHHLLGIRMCPATYRGGGRRGGATGAVCFGPLV